MLMLMLAIYLHVCLPFTLMEQVGTWGSLWCRISSHLQSFPFFLRPFSPNSAFLAISVWWMRSCLCLLGAICFPKEANLVTAHCMVEDSLYRPSRALPHVRALTLFIAFRNDPRFESTVRDWSHLGGGQRERHTLHACVDSADRLLLTVVHMILWQPARYAL